MEGRRLPGGEEVPDYAAKRGSEKGKPGAEHEAYRAGDGDPGGGAEQARSGGMVRPHRRQQDGGIPTYGSGTRGLCDGQDYRRDLEYAEGDYTLGMYS